MGEIKSLIIARRGKKRGREKEREREKRREDRKKEAGIEIARKKREIPRAIVVERAAIAPYHSLS